MNESNVVLMTPEHPQWNEFIALLLGEEGMNAHQEDERGWVWTCYGGNDKRFATAVLEKHFPEVDVPATLAFFEENGGYCDCEIFFNVDPAGNV